jgi:hypothetical protein
MSVITFAMHHKAYKLVGELLNITDIMRVDGFEETVYDVTDLVPEKEKDLLLGTYSSKKKYPKGCRIAPGPKEKEEESSGRVAVPSCTEFAANEITNRESNVTKLTQSSGKQENTRTKMSPNEESPPQKCFMVKLIELILAVNDDKNEAKREDKPAENEAKPAENEVKRKDKPAKHEIDPDVVELFESNPVKLFVTNTLGSFNWFGRVLLIFHLTHMFLFAAYALPNANELAVQTSCVRLPESKHASAAFCIWPAIVSFIFLCDIILVKKELCITVSRLKEIYGERGCCANFFEFVVSLPMIVSTSFNYALSPEITTLAFSCASFVWCACRDQCVARETHIYLTAAVLIFGWMSTFYFTRIASFVTYNTIMKYYNFSFVFYFIFIYSYALLGFGLAFDVLFQFSDTMINATHQPWQTLITTLQLTFGYGDPLALISDSDFIGTYSDVGGDPGLVYFVYIIYVLGTAILMMNIFGAWLTNTTELPLMTKWSTIRSANVLKFCYCILHKFPWMLRLCQLTAPYRIEVEDGRLKMHVRKPTTVDRNELLLQFYDKRFFKGMDADPFEG